MPIGVRTAPPGFRVRAWFDSDRGDRGDRNGMGRACCRGTAVLFLPANTARQLVGISVGIGSNRRRKLLQIQMVIELGGYRPEHRLSEDREDPGKNRQSCPDS